MAKSESGVPDSLEALAQTVVKLRSERDGLREAMRNRAVIEQAKGMLAERLSLDPEQAFRHMIEMSTRNNVKVAELAAAVVAGRQPEPDEPTEIAVDTAPPVPDVMDAPEADSPPIDPNALRSEVSLIGGRIEAATNFDEIAESLSVATSGWPAPANVILLLVEGDGALRLVGSAGLSPTTRSQWDRVPPIENVPVVAAVQNRAPVYLADLEAVSRQFPVVADRPHEALVAMPLMNGDEVVGVLELTWATSPTMDKHTRSHLLWLAEPAARQCHALSARSEAFTNTSISDDAVDTSLVSLFLEALSFPAVLLQPRYGENNQLLDFDPVYSNSAAAPVTTRPNGRPMSLMTALPDSGARQLLPAFAATLRGGQPCMLRDIKITTMRDGHPRMFNADIRGTRVWEKLLVTWRVESEPARHFGSLLNSEKTFGTGGFYWDLDNGEIRWTPGMYRLAGLDPEKGTPPVDTIVSLIHPRDQESLVKEAMETLKAGRELRKELRGHGDLDGRVFRVVATPELTPSGELKIVRGAVREITTDRRLGDQLRRERMSVAAARGERDNLRTALEPLLTPLRLRGGTAGVEISGHSLGCGAQSARSWYDAVDLPTGRVALIVGEVHGDQPTAPMLRLRLSTAAFALAGMNPAEAMSAANTAFIATVPDRTATMTLASLDPATGALTWATSGQASPVLSLASKSRNQATGSLGLPIGADSPLEFPLNQAEMEPGDQLLLYTEGLLMGPGNGGPRMFEALREAAAAASAELAFEKVSDAEPRVAEAEASLLLVRRES
ncbi:SpoIIE family protein phosphatase [Stackebrandtia nassauensis]|uniref:Putative PAS/PAC sensor protein n=1 Tax=Stackebrandtia nassauensis (strain DSM 44728 / CIP 108903 / NRRL B-16338 / NBRC 102104 / LLR-40K-21) TaxID=446470 RepID=D3Q8A2_STANL|nr:SpoIIE family protein phosphatase [Stackebrandtia nassauensis]ADD42476.1 putative PAS/PAC sensor protein [Stackebrandtia nassauensis DSM 44728]